MKSKQSNRLGTAILLSLAPAAALGVTASVISSYRQPEEEGEKEVTKDIWFQEFAKKEAIFISTYNTYDPADIKAKHNGVDATVDCIYNYKTTFNSTTIRKANVYIGKNNVSIISSTYELQNISATCSTKYYLDESKSTQKILFELNDMSRMFNFDKNGYIIEYVAKRNGQTDSYTFEYTKDPYFVQTIKMGYVDADTPYYRVMAQMHKDTVYTYTFAIKQGSSINKIWAQDYQGNPVSLTNYEIYIDDVKQSDWSYNTETKIFSHQGDITSGTIKFNFSVTADMDCINIETSDNM